MARPEIGDFIGPRGDLHQDSRQAVRSHAASLLTLGLHLTGDTRLLDQDAPQVKTAAGRLDGQFDREDAHRFMAWLETGQPAYAGTLVDEGHAVTDVASVLWQAVRTSARAEATAAAAALLHLNAESEHDLVRAVAAAEASRISEADQYLRTVLRDTADEADLTASTIAGDALLRLGDEQEQGDRGGAPDSSERISAPARTEYDDTTSVMVHGTWASLRSRWWQPSGELFDYVRSGLSQNLYDGPDFFRWDGRYRATSRLKAAGDLQHWARIHHFDRFDAVYAHSHGGNVVLDALDHCDVRATLLVLMSTPARKREPEQWQRILNRVGRIVHVHAKFDLVVLTDRAPQRFGSHVHDITLPDVWLSHSAVLKPPVWERYDLGNHVRYAHAMAAEPLSRLVAD